jgi:hypothetical protein
MWRFLNDRTLFKLFVPAINSADFNLNLKKLTTNELELDFDWEMNYISEETDDYKVALKVKLVKLPTIVISCIIG